MSTLLPKDDNGHAVQALRYKDDGASVETGTAGNAIAAAIAFSADAEFVSIKTNAEITVKFGTDDSVTADANDHGFMAGESEVIPLTNPQTGKQHYTHMSIYFVEDGKVYVSERE